MARKMTEWPSKRGPITKIMPSDGCIGDTAPLAVGKWYDFHEFGWYMGMSAHITGGGRGRHVGPRQVGIDIQVEFGRASLDTAQHKVFDGVVADRTQAQGVLHRAVKHLEIEGLHKPKDWTYSRLPALPMRASRRRRRVGKASGSSHPASVAA